jgi:hypothetical protein
MKRIALLFSACVLAPAMVSCGGSQSSHEATFSLGKLDDNFTVKSYKMETDAKEKSVEQVGKIKGTITLVVKRNKEELKYKPSDVDYAYIKGETSASNYLVFNDKCDAVVKKILKMEPGKEETFTIGFSSNDPYMSYKSDEENAEQRQIIYDALTKKGGLDQISIDVEFEEDVAETVKALKAIKDLEDMMDDDDE